MKSCQRIFIAKHGNLYVLTDIHYTQKSHNTEHSITHSCNVLLCFLYFYLEQKSSFDHQEPFLLLKMHSKQRSILLLQLFRKFGKVDSSERNTCKRGQQPSLWKNGYGDSSHEKRFNKDKKQ